MINRNFFRDINVGIMFKDILICSQMLFCDEYLMKIGVECILFSCSCRILERGNFEDESEFYGEEYRRCLISFFWIVVPQFSQMRTYVITSLLVEP